MSTHHINLNTPCGEKPWDTARVCRDLGLPFGSALVSVCGHNCSNPQHVLAGTRAEAQALRLKHLLTSERTRNLSLRELAARAGCSHGTVATHKKRHPKLFDYTKPKATEKLKQGLKPEVAGSHETEQVLSEYLEKLRTGCKVTNKYRIQVLNTVVSDPAYLGRSNQRLATLLGVTAPTVAAARRRVGIEPSERECADGRVMRKQWLPVS